jgi:hypothetical protein
MYNNLGCTLPYEGERDATNIRAKFLQITGIITEFFVNLQYINNICPTIWQGNLDTAMKKIKPGS